MQRLGKSFLIVIQDLLAELDGWFTPYNHGQLGGGPGLGEVKGCLGLAKNVGVSRLVDHRLLDEQVAGVVEVVAFSVVGWFVVVVCLYMWVYG